MFKLKVFAVLALLACSCESSTLKSLDELETEVIEVTERFVTEASTEEIQTEAPSIEVSSENVSSGLSEPAAIGDGSLFKMMMTIKQTWTDEFMNKRSEPFTNLANGIGSELIDFVDNSQEAKEPNMTNFKLVEVRPSINSSEKVYATFVVTSKGEISGEDLYSALYFRISMTGSIYNYEVTTEGFSITNITAEEAKDMESETIACSSDEGGLEFFKPDSTKSPVMDKPQSNDEKSNHLPSKCQREKIQRGATSIYIFENQLECFDGVRNEVVQQGDASSEETRSDEPINHDDKCSKNVKRSVEEETIIVVKKRGDKVFIEI